MGFWLVGIWLIRIWLIVPFPAPPGEAISVPLRSGSAGGDAGQAVQSRPPRAPQGCTSSGSGLNGALAELAQASSALPGFHHSFWRHHLLCRYLFLARSAISSKQRVWIIVYSQDRLFFLYLCNQGEMKKRNNPPFVNIPYPNQTNTFGFC